MSDNLNIEELFRSNLGSLEADVSPNAWSNIQQGLQAQAAAGTAVAAKTGLSVLVKSIIIGGGIVAATVAGVYFFSDNEENNKQSDVVVAVDQNKISNVDELHSVDTHGADPAQDDSNGSNEADGSDNGDQNHSNPVNNQPVNSNINNGGTTTTASTNSGSGTEVTTGPGNNGTGNGGTATTGGQTGGDPISDQGDPTTTNTDQPADSTTQVPVQKPIQSDLQVFNEDNTAPATFRFESNAENCSKVTWDFGDGETAVGFNVEHTYAKPGNYTVQASCSQGSQGHLDAVEVTVESIAKIVQIPNVISPNGDNKNDFFTISTVNMEKLSIFIRDSRGQLVFSSDDINFRWYGTDLGNNTLSGGNYIYQMVAIGIDGKEFNITGQITLTDQ